MNRICSLSLVAVVIALPCVGCDEQAPQRQINRLPTLAAELAQAKTECQVSAARFKSKFDGRLQGAKRDQGAKLYGDAQAKLDGCIKLLQAGLANRFQGVNDALIKHRAGRGHFRNDTIR